MLNYRFLSAINDIDATSWNSLLANDYPFLKHQFLAALENSGSVTLEQGWQPFHLIVEQHDQLVASLPLYLKEHSYGEYVFDWSWADAYHRNGIQYYPKLLGAIPFTPATGPRVSIAADQSPNQIAIIIENIEQAIIEKCQELELESAHLLFPSKNLSERLSAQWLQRRAVQFHWYNNNFKHFNDFLMTFNSRKRKNLNKERRNVAEAGIKFKQFTGRALQDFDWELFYHFYQLTYAKRSGHGGYLSLEFFQQIGRSLADQILLILAFQGDTAIAGALNFKDSECLYGRYWGCEKEMDFLHFETCYYQGIEFCIANSIQRFDPGAQGEHKIQRGFTPTYTYSNHWIARPEFRRAIANFLQRESSAITAYYQEAYAMLPFKQITK